MHRARSAARRARKQLEQTVLELMSKATRFLSVSLREVVEERESCLAPYSFRKIAGVID